MFNNFCLYTNEGEQARRKQVWQEEVTGKPSVVKTGLRLIASV